MISVKPEDLQPLESSGKASALEIEILTAVAQLPDVFEDEQAALPELRVSEAHRPIGDWIGERCELAPGARTRASELYADFERWCDGRGMEARGIGSFGKMLGAFGVGAVKSNGMWRVGIRLRS